MSDICLASLNNTGARHVPVALFGSLCAQNVKRLLLPQEDDVTTLFRERALLIQTIKETEDALKGCLD